MQNEKEVKLVDTSEKKKGKLKDSTNMGGSFKDPKVKEISDIEAKINHLEEMLRMAKG